MHSDQALSGLMDRIIFGATEPPVVVADSIEMLGFELRRTIRIPSCKKGVDFSALFRAGRTDLPRRFLQGQDRVVLVCTSALYLQRLSTVQFRQPPGSEKCLNLAFMNRPAYCSEIAQSIGTRVVTVPDLCHVMCQRVMIPFIQTGVMMQVYDVHREPMLVRVIRIENVVEVQAYRFNDRSVLPRSYMVMGL